MTVPTMTMSMEGPAAIRTAGVVKRYGRKPALDGLDLLVPEQSIYLLAGENGAGKSTTLRLLLHLEEPDRGTIELLGHDVLRDAAAARARIGYVSDEGVTPYGWLRVGALVAHHAAYYRDWDSEYAGRLMTELQIDPRPRISELSRGQARRIAFVLALAHRPALLLLDEPTDGLDPVVRERVLHRIAEHAAESPTTIVISTHLIHEVERLADHVGLIAQGRMVGQMSRDVLRGALNRYRFDVPEAWRAPESADSLVMRRSASGKENEWTIWGERDAVRDLLIGTGAEVRSITPLTLADAVVAMLSREKAA